MIEKEEVEPEDPYEILNDDDPNHLDASEIITYIESYGYSQSRDEEEGSLEVDIWIKTVR